MFLYILIILSFSRSIHTLHPQFQRRLIKWVLLYFISYNIIQVYVYLGNKKVRSDRDLDDDRQCYSQPATTANLFDSSILSSDTEIHSFSQPTQVDDLLLSSQLFTSQSTSTPPPNVIGNYLYYFIGYIKLLYFQNSMQRLVKRMTRFLVSLSSEEALTNLSLFLDDLGYTWKMNSPSLVSTVNMSVITCY